MSIVDDDDNIRLGLRHMLEELEEFDITEAGDGQVALDAMVGIEFELLLLNIKCFANGGVRWPLTDLRCASRRSPKTVVTSSETCYRWRREYVGLNVLSNTYPAAVHA